MANKRKWLSLLLSASMLFSMLATIGMVSAEATEDTEPAVVWTWNNSFDQIGDGASQKVVAADFSAFGDTKTTQAVELTLTDVNTAGNFWLDGGASAGFAGDLTQYPGAYMSLYVKLPDDHEGMNFGIAFVTGDWGSAKSQEVTLAAGGEWQQIIVPLNANVLSMTSFGLMRMTAINADNFQNGDKLSLAGIRVWSGRPTFEIEEEEPANVLWTAGNNFGYLTGGVSQETVAADFSAFGDTKTTQAVELTLTDVNTAGNFWLDGGASAGFAGDLTQYPGAYMSLYVKLPDDHEGMNFGIAFVTGDWGSAKSQEVTLAAGGEWQQIIVPLNANVLSMTSFGLMRMTAINADNFQNGDKLSLAGIRVWDSKPAFSQIANQGASIRETDPEGNTALRFKFGLDCEGVVYEDDTHANNNYRRVLTEDAVVYVDGVAYPLVDFGAVASADDSKELTLEDVSGNQVVKVPALNLYEIAENGEVTFTAVATNIPAEKVDTTIYVRSYVQYRDANSVVQTLYGAKVGRSVFDCMPNE